MDLSAIIVILLVIGGIIAIAFIMGAVTRKLTPKLTPTQIPEIMLNSAQEPAVEVTPARRIVTPVSGNESEAANCPSCSKPLRSGDRFCAQCGYRLLTRCPSCSKPLRSGDRFCAQCGHSLLKETPSFLPTLKGTSDLVCPNCHAPLQPQDQFCGTCGADTAPSTDVTQWRGQ